jgi:glyoxylase-like metal-dependent hydrolase (beta-lactamase superfamily II)
MEIRIVPCGYLKVQAVEMIKPLALEEIRAKYEVDREGYMRLAMNALLVEEGDRKILIDPGTADFLPARLREEYGFEMPFSLEDVLAGMDLDPGAITDVLFTHLHFDHGSGAFKRIPGNIVKRFPNARYHVLEEHYKYALKPDRVEASSFSAVFFRRLEKIHWLEDWDLDWITFEVFHGHTREMVVPVIHTGEGKVCFMTDLIPMEIFMAEGTWCGYDLDPKLLLREKQGFLQELDPESRLIFFHDTLKDSEFYE